MTTKGFCKETETLTITREELEEHACDGVNWQLLQDRMLEYEAACAVAAEECFEVIVANGLTIYQAVGIFQTIATNEMYNMSVAADEEEEL